MEQAEIRREISLSYYDLCNYLIDKYGAAKFDYFPNPQCRAKRPKISRSSEGLYCHHIDEDKGGNLSSPASAQKQPFAWQKAVRLVYCNILEHMILHFKIAIMRQKTRIWEPHDISLFFSTRGFLTICTELNSLYEGNTSLSGYRLACYESVKANYDDYILILRGCILYLDSQYIGARNPRTNIRIKDTLISLEDTVEERDKKLDLYGNLSYYDILNDVIETLSKTYEGNLNLQMYYRLSEKLENDEKAQAICNAFSKDFQGYGFPQYTDLYLGRTQSEAKKSYGSLNVDEYISKAFPSVLSNKSDIKSNKPRFWKKDIPEEVYKYNLFFIIRIRATFMIKENQLAFVYDKRLQTLLSLAPDDDNNFLFRNGKLVEATSEPIEVTLTKDDYSLFFERYNILQLEWLDGCTL